MLAVIGALSVIAGVLLIRHPLGGVRAVALLLGIWLIAAGVVRLIAAFAYPGHRIWRIGAALVLGLFGIVIVSAPHIGYATLALIAGICFILLRLRDGRGGLGYACDPRGRLGQSNPTRER